MGGTTWGFENLKRQKQEVSGIKNVPYGSGLWLFHIKKRPGNYFPGLFQNVDAFFHALQRGRVIGAEGDVFFRVIAAPDGEIDAPA